MKILVSKVSKEDKDFFIDFSSEFGNGTAVWNGNRSPEENKEYDVQFDITDPLEWNEDIVLSKENKYSINTTKEGIFITGILENTSKDGLADLKFGNSIIQLETEGSPIPKGKYITVRADTLEVYDANM